MTTEELKNAIYNLNELEAQEVIEALWEHARKNRMIHVFNGLDTPDIEKLREEVEEYSDEVFELKEDKDRLIKLAESAIVELSRTSENVKSEVESIKSELDSIKF